METHSLDTILAQIEAAEREAAALMLHAHGILAETKTGRRDVVTEYDRRVQALLMQRLTEAVPGARFFCEETPERGEVTVGAVYNPYVDELFTAVRGEGASLNGRPIRVTDAGLADSVVCYGTSPYDASLSGRTFALARKVYEASLDLRREGSAALDLCTVAAGRAGLYFELQTSLWDYAAGALIVREAGGLCCRTDGSPFRADGGKTDIAAGSPAAVAEFLRLANAPDAD